MKNTFLFLFAISIITTSCNSSTQDDKDYQDSIAAEAAADSLLNSALEADSTELDNLQTDSTDTVIQLEQ